MREIKFRSWDKENKKIVQSDSLKDFVVTFFGDVCYINGNGDFVATNDNGFVNDQYILMQYIGTQDKNGKDIYEGDIYLCANGERCVVKYFDKYSRFALSNNSVESKLPMRIVLWSEGEVIGNIRQHAHLLEVQHG